MIGTSELVNFVTLSTCLGIGFSPGCTRFSLYRYVNAKANLLNGSFALTALLF